MILTIIVFVVILALLIFVHEAGHFIVAKISRVKVLEFAFGFPPKIIAVKRRETTYAINAIPLGGYVKLFGEEEKIQNPGSFMSKPVWKRILIVTSGAVMNFVLAIILMTIGFSIGMTPLVSDPATMSGQKTSQVMIVYIEPNSSAAQAGLVIGEILNGFNSTSDLQTFTHSHLGQEVTFSIEKNGTSTQRKVHLSSDERAPLGIGIISIAKVKQNILQAFWTSIKETGKVVTTLFVFLWDILKSFFTTGKGGPAAEGVVGPVGLFNFTSEALTMGWIYVLRLVILLSVNLGIINLLPFPALDGGKVLFLALEGIFKRKVVRQEIENIIQLVGFALLILLIIAITYRDIINLR